MRICCNASGLNSLPFELRSSLIKPFIKEASAHARDCMYETLPSGRACRLLRLSSIARMVLQKCSNLLNELISKFGFVSTFP